MLYREQRDAQRLSSHFPGGYFVKNLFTFSLLSITPGQPRLMKIISKLASDTEPQSWQLIRPSHWPVWIIRGLWLVTSHHVPSSHGTWEGQKTSVDTKYITRITRPSLWSCLDHSILPSEALIILGFDILDLDQEIQVNLGRGGRQRKLAEVGCWDKHRE